MSSERLGSRTRDDDSEDGDIRVFDDLNANRNGEPIVDMDIDNMDLLLDEDEVVGDEVEDRLDESSGAHSSEYDFDDGHSDGIIDDHSGLEDEGQAEDADEDDEEDDEGFNERSIDALLSANGSIPALEAISRLRRLVSPMAGREGWQEEDDEEADEEGSDVRNGNGGGVESEGLHISLLDAIRGTYVNPRTSGILTALRSNYDPVILTGLSDLSSLLLTSQDGFSFLPVVPLANALVNLLRRSETIEVQVMTARAMSQLIDSESGHGATKALVRAGVVPVLRRIFENVFYIDLIEQLIHVVKPVAVTEPQLVLESGCLMPCVNTLDFFNEYIQREIMVAIDSCAKDITLENVEHAKNLLAIFPENPNDNVIGTYSALIIAIAKLNLSDFKEIASQTMWDNLISHVQPGTPHVARIMRAVAHTAARCPHYARNFGMIADLVHHTLIQDSEEGSADLFSKLIFMSKDVLFAGLKVLQVVLPLPGLVGKFSGPYRKEQTTGFEFERDELLSYARTAVPLAIASFSASVNTPVRQLAILVVMQVVAVFRDDAEFAALARQLRLVPFVAQVISEGRDHLALVAGGFDIAWDMTLVNELIPDVANAGIAGDLAEYTNSDGSVREPQGHFSPSDNLEPVVTYMAHQLLERIRKFDESSNTNVLHIIELVKRDDYDVKDLLQAPLPNLIRAGLLDALDNNLIKSRLCGDMVTLLQSAIIRLERFELQLTGSKAKSIEEVLSRQVYVRLAQRNTFTNDRPMGVYIPAFATIKTLEDFVGNNQHAQHISLSGRTHEATASVSRSRFRFWVGNRRVPRDVSVLKAIQGQSGTPVLRYERVDENEAEEEEEDDNAGSDYEINESIQEPLATALRLLRIFAEENERRGEIVSWELFRSAKITAKLSRQLSDVPAIVASMLPQWTFDTVREFPFLYPLKVRLHFVQLTSFGMGRNLQLLRRMQRDGDDNDDDVVPEEDETNQILGRHKHQKFRLSRDSILEGTLKMLEISSKSPAVVEVMFFGEEGTGKGPTQEFFALASQALSNENLGMWTRTPAGLYPRSNTDPDTSILLNFRGMGRLVARGLLDKRILDFSLNPAFFEAVLSESGPSIAKLRKVDPELASSLDKLLDSSAKELTGICLDFTLPGTDIELLPSGKDIEITSENVGDYVQLVCDFVVGSGIQKQIDAFREGFSDTMPVFALKSFMFDELATLCGADRSEDWSLATLRDAFTADHGYQLSSEPVQQLLNILSTFDRSERRKFLMFATGSPHLPVGGFKSLTPPFTVVVKHPDNEELEIDQYLPSVMTCANYFKLPAYSSEEVMRQQLKVAISEGSDAFLLS